MNSFLVSVSMFMASAQVFLNFWIFNAHAEGVIPAALLPTHGVYGTDNRTGVTKADLYVDSNLDQDCTAGNYSIKFRNCTGTAGDAFRTIAKAVENSGPGKVIGVRGGLYNIFAQVLNSRTLVAIKDEAVELRGCIMLDGTGAALRDVAIINNSRSECGDFHAAIGFAPTSVDALLEYNYIETFTVGDNGSQGVSVAAGAKNARIRGNHIHGVQNTRSRIHVMSADGLDIDGNRISSEGESINDDDGISAGTSVKRTESQMTTGSLARIRNNYFENTFNDSHIDYKGTRGPQTIEITNNYVNGDGKRSPSYPCFLMWAHTQAYTATVNLRRNFFKGCTVDGDPGAAIAFGTHLGCAAGDCTHFTGLLEQNVFYCRNKNAMSFSSSMIRGPSIINNTFINCDMSVRSDQPVTIPAFRSNVWSGGNFTGSGLPHLSVPTGNCTHNNFFNVGGISILSCTKGTAVDPGFVGEDLQNPDFAVTHPQLINTSHNGKDRGAVQVSGRDCIGGPEICL